MGLILLPKMVGNQKFSAYHLEAGELWRYGDLELFDIFPLIPGPFPSPATGPKTALPSAIPFDRKNSLKDELSR